MVNCNLHCIYVCMYVYVRTYVCIMYVHVNMSVCMHLVKSKLWLVTSVKLSVMQPSRTIRNT